MATNTERSVVHAGEGAETTVLPCVLCTVPERTGVSTGTTGRTRAAPGRYWSVSAAILLRTPELWLWPSPRGKLLPSDAELAILVARYQAIESIPALLEEDADGGAELIA